MPVTVTNNTGTILVDDGNSKWYIKKQKAVINTEGTMVIIRGDNVHYSEYEATTFTSPAGTASEIAAAIAVFLDT